MTTVAGDNIFNIAIEGNFDQAQDMVKASFGDQSFAWRAQTGGGQQHQLGAHHGADRVLLYSALNLGGHAPWRTPCLRAISAIFFAHGKKMGLPIEQLIIATNSNDVLHRLMSKTNTKCIH